MLTHEQLLEKNSKGKIDVYFLGNSISRRWGATDYLEFLANWKANFVDWNAADFGWGADHIEHMLWRIEHGEFDGVNPKVIVLLAGTNNVGNTTGDDAKISDITRGLKALIDFCRQKAPKATMILTGIFPRNDNIAVVPEINRINENLKYLANGTSIRYLNSNDKLTNADGVLLDGMTVDKLHPTVKGYQRWADALKPVLTELLGPLARTDLAPPPTGDPSATPRATAPAGTTTYPAFAAPASAAPVSAASAFAAPASASASVSTNVASTLRLPPIFASGMVLQRHKPVVVWGWASPTAQVTVSLDAQRVNATASRTGEWIATLPAQRVGAPRTLTIASGTERIVLTDVVVGDVWVASGESNMKFTLDRALDAPREIASANDLLLRQFKSPTSWSNEPSAELAGGTWISADPAHAGAFSAVGYYFASALRSSENVPIGIINTTWGGSDIETWISRSAQGVSDDTWRDMQRKSAIRAESTAMALGRRSVRYRAPRQRRPIWQRGRLLTSTTLRGARCPSPHTGKRTVTTAWTGWRGIARRLTSPLPTRALA